nr:SHOCT domain-containing protein [Methanobacterium formicicum]
MAEKLKKAKELLDIGALSQEEFDEIKQRYLKDF